MSTTYEFIEADNTVTREFMREQNTERNRIFGEFEKNSGIKWSFVLEAGIMEGGREPNLAVYSNLNCDPPISFRAYGNGADEALDNAYRIAAMISDLDGEPRKYAIFLPRNSFVAPDNKSEVGRVPGAPKKVSPSAEKVELSSPYKVTLPVSPKSGAPLVSASCQKCHDLQDQVDVLTTSNQNLTAKLSEARSEIEMTKKALTPTVYLYDSTSSRSYNKSWETNGYVYNFKAFDVVLSPEEIVRDGNVGYVSGYKGKYGVPCAMIAFHDQILVKCKELGIIKIAIVSDDKEAFVSVAAALEEFTGCEVEIL